jgi:hypothetical protein
MEGIELRTKVILILIFNGGTLLNIKFFLCLNKNKTHFRLDRNRFKSTLKRNSIANLICFSIVLDVSNFTSLPKYSIARIVVDQTILWNVLVIRSKLKLESSLKI